MRDPGYHSPDGDPCKICGRAFTNHKVDHKCMGEPCARCGLASTKHKIRGPRDRADKDRTYFIGIDGEGVGKKDHHYIMMCAASEHNDEWWSVYPKKGMKHLTTEECLDFILDLPERFSKIFSYAFNYDLTKMLADLDNANLYKFFRPELRARKGKYAALGPKPIEWNGYKLNLQGTKFSVSKDGRRKVIWDLFKFFQGKFVTALKTWQIGSPALWDRMSGMKDNRSDFEELLKRAEITKEEIAKYCIEECTCMAQLARKLLTAHEDAGLQLKTYYGAGSSGGAMLSAMRIQEQNVPVPIPMRFPVACSFFGGRFENSFTGAINRPVYMKDISSAYPYQTTFLPCLECGTWRKVKNREGIEGKRIALVKYCFSAKPITSNRWGPFPFRTRDGAICFPEYSAGGWIWQDEFKEGERLFSNVRFVEAWVYDEKCKHRPFNQIPEYYILRIKLGKEGAGLVIKLAVNSVYGKLAQSVGNAIYNNWIWASLITSGTRAQLLNGLGRHRDWDNVLMMATDSIGSLEDVMMDTPKPTGTAQTGKPLGGWEGSIYEKGIFLARPGIYFPINPDEKEISKIKARGIGRGVLLNNWPSIVENFEAMQKGKIDTSVLRIANISRFCGGKTSISVNRPGVYSRAGGGTGKDGREKPCYGQWVGRSVDMSFNPMPKREKIMRDGRLKIRSLDSRVESSPYRKSVMSFDAKELKAAQQMMMEQPNADMVEITDVEFVGGV